MSNQRGKRLLNNITSIIFLFLYPDLDCGLFGKIPAIKLQISKCNNTIITDLEKCLGIINRNFVLTNAFYGKFLGYQSYLVRWTFYTFTLKSKFETRKTNVNYKLNV